MRPLLPVAILLTTWASPAQANPLAKVCDPDDAQSCVQPMMPGDPAPFAGQLLTNRRAAKLAVLAGGCQDRIDLEVARERELAAISLSGEQALRSSDLATAKLKEELLLRRMAEMENVLAPRWYERPAFVAVVSSVVTVSLLVVSVKAVQILQ